MKSVKPLMHSVRFRSELFCCGELTAPIVVAASVGATYHAAHSLPLNSRPTFYVYMYRISRPAMAHTHYSR